MGSVANALGDIINPKQSNINAQNEGFRKAADRMNHYIESNTGKAGYKEARNAGIRDGRSMYQGALGDAKNETSGLADRLTSKQANGAASQALGNAVSSGMTRGRAAMDAGQSAANAYSQNYANNYNTQLAQQNQLMNTNLGQQNNMMNAMNQQLANQVNSQGSLMGANLQNDQAEWQQQWGNVANKKKEGLGLGALVGSDKRLKDSVKVGIDGDEDCRMARYKRAGEKLKRINPNKWNDLKWRSE